MKKTEKTGVEKTMERLKRSLKEMKIDDPESYKISIKLLKALGIKIPR